MNAQLHSISGQMVPLMEHYIVHPKVCRLWITEVALFESLMLSPQSA